MNCLLLLVEVGKYKRNSQEFWDFNSKIALYLETFFFFYLEFFLTYPDLTKQKTRQQHTLCFSKSTKIKLVKKDLNKKYNYYLYDSKAF